LIVALIWYTASFGTLLHHLLVADHKTFFWHILPLLQNTFLHNKFYSGTKTKK
jgi:hypothetical protein